MRRPFEQRFLDLSEQASKQVADLNFLGTIVPCQVFGGLIAGAGDGNIINIASMADFRLPPARLLTAPPSRPSATSLSGWRSTWRRRTPEDPGQRHRSRLFRTRQNHFLLYDETTNDLTPRGRAIIEHAPMRRFGNPNDLLGALLRLLSSGAEFVTGAVIAVDG